MSENLSFTVYKWLQELNIPVSKTYLNQQLLSHPDYPSLLSITDTLNELGIENTAVQIEKEQLNELPLPFIAHLNGKGGEFAVIKNIENIEKKTPGFFNRWGGVVVAAEKPENWFHKTNNEWLSRDNKKGAAILLSLTVLAFFIFLSGTIVFDWVKAGLLLIAAAGIFISWLIVSKDLGIENKIADQVCGADADCNSVIHSPATKLPFIIGWSDAGIIYFSFLLLSLVISSFNNSIAGVYSFLSLLSVAALPLTVVSFYYQWRVIKKWCRLCLVTVALLWLQFFVLMPKTISLLLNGFDNTILSKAALASFLLFITGAAWYGLKPLLKENKKLEAENFAALRFKNNPEVFKALLEKQKRLIVNPVGLGITIGNSNANNTIIKVCNPYCGPCAKAHPVIDKLLEGNDNLKAQIIFTADGDEKDLKTKPVRHLMGLNEKNNKKLIQEALDDWYMAEEKEYDTFANKYILNGELEKQDEKLKSMKKWCDEVKIEFTPTFFVNGYQLPKQYKIEELKYFLEK